MDKMPSAKRLTEWFWIIWLLIDFASSSKTDYAEYCQWESFNATCDTSEIIMMTYSQYGRMHLGRCLTTDVYIGCGSDVLPQMDAKCSGRQSCELTLPDSSLHQAQPCPRDMMAYLEASYSCIKVATLPESHQCTDSVGIKPLTNSTGLLSSTLARRSGYGMPGCPWRIQVQPGQQIRVSLIDFGLAGRYQLDWYGADSEREYCYVYAMIREGKRGKEFNVCAANTRETVVYESTTNQIEVILLDGKQDSTQNFLVKYEAVGCADLTPPTGAHITRQKEGATITCNTTSQAWHLVCKDTEWVGEFGECNKGEAATGSERNGDTMPSYGLVLAILIGVAIGVMVGFTLLAAVLWCRRKRYRKTRDPPMDPGQMTTLPLTSSAPGTPGSCKIHRLKGEYGYTHVWEVQQSPGGNIPRAAGHHTPDSAYQSYQSQRGGPNPGDTLVCFHPKRDHSYESPKFETFGVVNRGDSTCQRPFYQGCGKTCTVSPHAKGPQCGDSLDNAGVHIEIGVEASAICGPVSTGGQPVTGYSMAGDTKAISDNPIPANHDNLVDPRGNHYT